MRDECCVFGKVSEIGCATKICLIIVELRSPVLPFGISVMFGADGKTVLPVLAESGRFPRAHRIFNDRHHANSFKFRAKRQFTGIAQRRKNINEFHEGIRFCILRVAGDAHNQR